MARVHVSTVIRAPLIRVWATIRDFNALPQWHPLIVESSIEDDLPGTTIGCVRRIRLKDGQDYLREQLVALSDLEPGCTYRIVDSPLAIENYEASLRLARITDPEATLAEWSAAFDVPEEDEAEIVALVTEIFRAGLENLNNILDPAT